MTSINWSISIQPSGGPTVTVSPKPVEAEAIDRMKTTVAAGASGMVVSMQPGSAAQVQMLLITSSYYGADLTVKVSDGATDTAAIVLSGPQLYTGGMLALFGMAPNQLKVTNASTSDAQLEIFIARDATP